MFVDIVEIKVKAGKGGRGLVSFRREKFVPFGGPSGGDGGRGGSVILVGDRRQRTLSWFKSKMFIVAKNGSPGKSSNMAGRNGEDKLVYVSVGTVVYEKLGEKKEFLSDIGDDGEKVVVAKGGKGGRGNARFATPTRQAPEIAQPGQMGEEKELILELKLIADVGIIGRPNAGKSTLLSQATRAKPKIASYPFTTTEPILGVVDVGWKQFVMAEIPGLIEGAHLGRGLGHEFLRHVERTKLLLHLIDGSSPELAEEWAQVNREILLYKEEVADKEQIVVVNKIDIPWVRERLEDIKRQLKDVPLPIHFISAASGEGVMELMKYVASHLKDMEYKAGEKTSTLRVFRPQPVDISGAGKGRDGG